METPVIYFYSQIPRQVRVEVGFPQGVISQWYPQAASFQPALGDSGLSGGQMTWNVNVVKGSLPVLAVDPHDVWAPSRQTRANFIHAGPENERFIFYRGLGVFDTPLRVLQVPSKEYEIQFANSSNEKVTDAILLRTDGRRGLVRYLSAIQANGLIGLNAIPSLDQEGLPMSEYLASVSGLLEKILGNSGLYNDEALAMVNTWSTSYFKTPGLRILYVLPRAWTDQILPLQMTPAPARLVRTLVGRIEIMTKEEEQSLLREVTQLAKTSAPFDHRSLGRFAEAKLRRVRQLTSDARVQSYISNAIGLLNQQ